MILAVAISNLSIDKCKTGSTVSEPMEILKLTTVAKLNTVVSGVSTSSKAKIISIVPIT